jgi:S-adenosylmethionine-diacylglycerol 3-amino-3-carboxypropyl transferase
MSIQEKVDLGILRYANCWEDADILLEGLALPPSSDILCIASAGDNALALLTTDPRTVHAIDLSKVQLYLTEFKQMCFKALEYEEVLQLLGVHPCSAAERKKLYAHIKPHLSRSAAGFWDEHLRWIEEGVIHQGKFERYFNVFRKYLLPLVHSRKKTEQLFLVTGAEEQRRFYNKEWNTFRWKLLMNIFFSKGIMGKYGRDPEFFRYVNMPVAKYIRQKAEAHFNTNLARENHLLEMIFTASFSHSLPLYLRKENFELIRNNISNLSLSNIPAEEEMQRKNYHAYALSNIFEYLSAGEFESFVGNVKGYINPGSRLAYWNLMASRSFADVCTSSFKRDEEVSMSLTARDKGFFYSRFLIEEKI